MEEEGVGFVLSAGGIDAVGVAVPSEVPLKREVVVAVEAVEAAEEVPIECVRVFKMDLGCCGGPVAVGVVYGGGSEAKREAGGGGGGGTDVAVLRFDRGWPATDATDAEEEDVALGPADGADPLDSRRVYLLEFALATLALPPPPPPPTPTPVCPTSEAE